MITIKPEDKNAPPTKTLAEVLDLINGAAQKLGAENVSGDRRHSIESHLRGIIRRLGYRPRETENQRADIVELADQCVQALGLREGVAPEARHEEISWLALATLSNLEAELRGWTGQSTEIVKDLPAVAATKAKGAAAAMLLFAALLCGLPAQAADSFNITNIIPEGLLIASYPTNTASTNIVTLGYTTNVVGSVTNVVTNTITLNQLTGRAIETRNYAWGAFKFQGLCSSSNGSTVVITPIRAVTSGTPPNENFNAGTPILSASDFETTAAQSTAQPSIAIPIPKGTNLWVTWVTNLDEWFTKPADYVGIYSITNQGAVGDVVSNASCWFGKKIMPFSLSGGN